MKVLCKKRLSLLSGTNLVFNEGEFYTLLDEYGDYYWIQIQNKGAQRFNKPNAIYNGYSFGYSFNEYFYSVQETRKIKLCQLGQKQQQ